MNRYEPPELGSQKFNCPHCGALAHQYWYVVAALQEDTDKIVFEFRNDLEELLKEQKYADIPEATKENLLLALKRQQAGEVFFHGDIQPYKIPVVHSLNLSKCFSCEKFSVWMLGKLVLPNNHGTIPPADDMPDAVKRLYLEAAAISSASPRSAAALLRVAVEVLCNEINESTDTIFDGIGKLVKKGLDTKIQKALDIVRITGNNAVHPGQIDQRDQQSDVDTIFRLINVIVERLITVPNEIDNLYNDLPEDKRSAISRRDAPK